MDCEGVCVYCNLMLLITLCDGCASSSEYAVCSVAQLVWSVFGEYALETTR